MASNEIQIGLGERIKYWREKAGLSSTDLAKKLGVDQSAVSHWECGRANPQSKHVMAAAAACGIDMRRFWGPMGRQAKAAGG